MNISGQDLIRACSAIGAGLAVILEACDIDGVRHLSGRAVVIGLDAVKVEVILIKRAVLEPVSSDGEALPLLHITVERNRALLACGYRINGKLGTGVDIAADKNVGLLCLIGHAVCHGVALGGFLERTEALMGAELILIPTVNTKAEPSEMFEWELKVQAFHSSVFIAMCNRVGTEGDMDFSGESIVVDPNGDTVIKADDTEQLVYADIDLSKATNIRRHRPYTTLRRPELYK